MISQSPNTEALMQGQKVIFNTPAGEREGTFVRYVKRRTWPITDDHQRALVKTIHRPLGFMIDTSQIIKIGEDNE